MPEKNQVKDANTLKKKKKLKFVHLYTFVSFASKTVSV